MQPAMRESLTLGINPMNKPIFIDRPPRIQPELPFDEIEIPAPPDKPKGGWERLIQVALPLITIIGFIAVSSMGGNRNPLMVLPMALAVVASTGFAVYSYFKEKREQAEHHAHTRSGWSS